MDFKFKFITIVALFSLMLSCTDFNDLVNSNDELEKHHQHESTILFNDILIWNDGKTDPVLLSDETKLKSFIDKRLHFNIRKYGMYDEFGVMRSIDDNVYIFAKFYSEAEDVKLTSYIYTGTGNDSAMAPDFSCKEKLCCHQCVPQNHNCTCHNIDIPCHIVEKRWICEKVAHEDEPW